MKKSILALVTMILLASCSTGEDYKEHRGQVLTVHDKVMMDSEFAIRNRMKLDTIVTHLDSVKKLHPDLDTLKEKQEILSLRDKLNNADEEMSTWMHEFDAELGSKSNQEAVTYFKSEKKKISSIDSLFSGLIKESDSYLKKFK